MVLELHIIRIFLFMRVSSVNYVMRSLVTRIACKITQNA